jgi:predicted nucleic acid-binding protein
MKYLLDTCVVSELIKKNPNKQVVKWISGTTETNLFISVLTIGDLHKGIEKLPESRKKGKLHKWVKWVFPLLKYLLYLVVRGVLASEPQASYDSHPHTIPLGRA